MATAAVPIAESKTRRYIEVTAVVGVWVAISIFFHLERGHLLLGIPITAIFQLVVRRQPLRTLWVRDSDRFSLGGMGWLLAVCLALYPAYRVFGLIHSGEPLAKITSGLVTVLGAVPLAFALRKFKRSNLKPLLLCLAINGGLTVLTTTIFALAGGLEHYTLAQRAQIFVTALLRYLPIGFLLEEVSFRGAFDSHLHRPGEGRGIASALFVSALWGLWHLPGAIGRAPLLATLPILVVVHSLLGVWLSIFWRKSGNLVVPATAHAFGDAVRNALLGAPL